nr:ATP-binding cassette domain-containing protein [Micromonospora sp. DSM 115978]
MTSDPHHLAAQPPAAQPPAAQPLDVEARDVRLRYGGTEALSGLSFHLEAGTICGLLGRNGSGKTSLM